MTTVAKRLEALLKSNQWNEYDLERESGVNQPTIHRIASGESKSPRLTNLTKIAKAFNVSVSYLTGQESSAGDSQENNYDHLPPAALKLIRKIEQAASENINEDDYLHLEKLLERFMKD